METKKFLATSFTADENRLGALAACHWSAGMLRLIKAGTTRPGAMRRALPGLTQKVQTACLTKMTHYGLLTRTAYGEVPPRVEYRLTPDGDEYTSLLDRLADLQGRLPRTLPPDVGR